MEKTTPQQLFFQHIRSKLSPNILFAEEIAEILDISTDSAYRRIRNEKPLTLDEIHLLCGKYNMSFDQVMNYGSDSIIFNGNIESDNFDFAKYLTGIMMSFRQISTARSKRMFYEAKDMPIFYHFQFAELAAFKYFFWMKTVLNDPLLTKTQYEDNELNNILLTSGKEIIDIYNKIPSVEIWSEESINATLHQIEYYGYSGIFRKKESIELLYAQFAQIIEHIKEQADCGEKFLIGGKPSGDTSNYQLYYNEVFLGHNSIMVETDGIYTAFMNHGTLNYMTTRDKKFCDYTRKTLDNTIKKSNLISNVGEKERNRFFNILNNKIIASKERVLG